MLHDEVRYDRQSDSERNPHQPSVFFSGWGLRGLQLPARLLVLRFLQVSLIFFHRICLQD